MPFAKMSVNFHGEKRRNSCSGFKERETGASWQPSQVAVIIVTFTQVSLPLNGNKELAVKVAGQFQYKKDGI